MAKAARVGDQTEHGTPLGPGPGSTNVFIEGAPAWRVLADTHTCPVMDGPQKPHVGGFVSSGSTKVFINKFFAARVGDKVFEPGASTNNEIKVGSAKVKIGD